MLLPRKLSPDSIEPWIALSAVVTPITEKTPMATPSIVSAERSLFVRNEPRAMRKISVKNMWLKPVSADDADEAQITHSEALQLDRAATPTAPARSRRKSR